MRPLVPFHRVPLRLLAFALLASSVAHGQGPDSTTLRQRRDRLAQAAKDGIVIVQAVGEHQAGLTEFLIDDSDNHDFLYLTGLDSPTGTLLVLPQSTSYRDIL